MLHLGQAAQTCRAVVSRPAAAAAAAAAAAKSLQSCSTLCDPIDGIPPGSPVPGILQARTLEWVAILPSPCAGGCLLFWGFSTQ